MNLRHKPLQTFSRFFCYRWPTQLQNRYASPTLGVKKNVGALAFQHNFYSSEGAEENIRKLRYMKKIFGFGLFGSVLFIEWISNRKKLGILRGRLEDCIKIPVDKELFKSRISLYKYHDFIYPEEVIFSGVLQEELPKFKFRDGDVIVASFPKAGSTWIQEIIYMLTHNLERSNDSSEALETRFPRLEHSYPGIKEIAKREGRRFVKTHLPATVLPDNFKLSEAKLIYLMRNPRDTAVFYWHFLRHLSDFSFTGSFEEFLQFFLADKVPYGPFYEHVRSYSELKDIRDILILSYESLEEDPSEIIRIIADYLQVPISDDDVEKIAFATSFTAMAENKGANYELWKDLGFSNNSNKGHVLRRGQVGEWKNYFTSKTVEDLELWRAKHDPREQFKFKLEL